MKFRKGDKVEFIYLGELKQGVVTEIEETKNAISYQIKYSGDMGMTWLDERELIAPATVLEVPQCVADWYEDNKDKLDYSIWQYIYCWDVQKRESDFYDFMNNNNLKPVETLIKMKDGYEVEKEPKCESEKLYIIEIDKNYMFSRIWIRSFETIAKELQYTIAHSKEEALSGDKLSMTTFACFLATHNSRHTYTVVPFNDSEGEA
ncbi:TPA: DUF1642 domain-containing protein [Listeria innocua]|nr:DUF1642 domain-containing protein [Listeria innocua]